MSPQSPKLDPPKRVCLAYSGGLDTSVIVRWLQDTYQCEVVTFTADIGQGEEVEPARAKAESLGVVFHERTRVVGLDHRADTWVVATERGRFEAPVVVNCAGAWGDQIAGWLGEAVPLRAGGLMMIVTARVPPFNDPVVGLTSRALSFKQTAAGTVLIGGTLHTGADRDRETTRLDFARVAKSGRTVSDVFPHLRGVPVMRCWAGIEGFTPDDIPVIGPSRTAPGIFHAFGYCGHGFELGPAVGGVIAELVTQGKTNIPIAPFAIDRFADGV